MRFRRGSRVLPGRLGPPALALVLAGLAPAAPARAQAAAAPAAEGKTLFGTLCVACHTVGGGALVGPDLAGVTERRPREWLLRWIREPDRMLAAGDPTAQQLFEEFHRVPMPNLGIDVAQAAALLAFLESGSAAAPARPAELPAGDPTAGKALFTGERRFANGGPPCMGCHSVAGLGALGGGALGPDLTPSYNKYGGAAGLASFLEGVPTPTMKAVWAPRPLTPAERADLRVFLEQASVSGRPIEAVGKLAALATGGAVLLLAVAQIHWRKRLVAVRRPLLARARQDRSV